MMVEVGVKEKITLSPTFVIHLKIEAHVQTSVVL